MPGNAPEQWINYTGPSSWYRLACPPTWSIEERDGLLQLRPGSGGGVLTLGCYWAQEPDSIDLKSAILLDQISVQRRRVRPTAPLDLPYESAGLQGEALLDPASQWWRRMIKRSPWHHWRAWGIRHGRICIVAFFLQAGEHDPETETIVGMVLRTLSISDEPADPPEVFAERVLELARRKFPLLECSRAEDFQLQVGESNINLFNFYRSYVLAPERFEDVVVPALATVVQVQEWGKEQTEPPLDQIRDRVMPMLYPEAVWRESFPNFVGTPWVAGLMILYVVDESHSYWYIRDDLLDRWSVSPHDLHSLALDNLNRYFEQHAMDFTMVGDDDEGPRLLMPNRPDAYNTSRLLSNPFRERLRELLGAQFAAGVPNRDFFVAVSLHSDEAIDRVRHRVAEDYAQMDHPLTDRLLLVSADGISELVESES